MNWLAPLARLLHKAPPLSAEQSALLLAFQTLAPCPADTLLASQRFVVVDVESTGLNVFSDKLISIGAVGVEQQTVQLGQSFETMLRQDAPSSNDNILIHGIGGTAQATGQNPPDALLSFLAYLGNAPLVAYHASFDRTMINRATQSYLGITLQNTWVDLALVAPALFPESASGRRALDDWTALFHIENPNRHNAVADACATAQLLLVVLAQAGAQGIPQLHELVRLEKDQRWLSRG